MQQPQREQPVQRAKDKAGGGGDASWGARAAFAWTAAATGACWAVALGLGPWWAAAPGGAAASLRTAQSSCGAARPQKKPSGRILRVRAYSEPT